MEQIGLADLRKLMITVPCGDLPAARETEGTGVIEAKKLKDRDGAWTEAAIRKFLPSADIEVRRSYQHGNYKVRIFRLVDVVTAEKSELFSAHRMMYLRRLKRQGEVATLPLIDAIREASRSAHRWRDRAASRWARSARKAAGSASHEKSRWYALKDRGIAAAYENGLLRYAGGSPQGMAVYEYDGGGMSCFHSTLHPANTVRNILDGHPEVLMVPAKRQELRLKDVEHTLSSLPEIDSQKYERSSAPQRKAEPAHGPQCWECGEYGHLARECD
jgi:hypothetical protein